MCTALYGLGALGNTEMDGTVPALEELKKKKINGEITIFILQMNKQWHGQLRDIF